MKVKSSAGRFAVIAFLLFTVNFFFITDDLFSQQDSWYDGKPIKDIVFSGLRNIQSSELEALMNPYKGRSFNDSIFSEILGKLYALEYFESIEPGTARANPDGTEVILRFTVVERPVVKRINFIGNSGVRRHVLNTAIITKVTDIYNEARLRDDIEAIKQKYIENGYPNVSVTVDESHAADGITINFRITESEKISILRIDFQGNSKFTESTLKSQLSLKARTRLSAGAFQEAKLIEDREAIAKYYHDRGYINAAVRDVTRTYGQDDKGANIVLTFMIEEGEEYRFGGINFEGNNIFSTEQLNKLVSSRKGDPVNASRVEMDLQRIADLYYENGYLYNSIIRTVDLDTETNTLSYTLTIVERGRAYIENIVIIGNEKTKTHVIEREIPLEPGDVFSRTKVINGVRDLYNLQYFSMVMPDIIQGSTENLMDLVVTVEEQQTTTLQFGLTFSGSSDPDTFPISGMIELTDRNFRGSGNQLGFRINSSIVDSTAISVNYLHRWIFGLPLSLGTDLSILYTKRRATTDNRGWFNGDEEYAFPDGFISRQEYEDNNKLPAREYLMPYEQWYVSLGFSTGYRWHTPAGILGTNGGFRFGMIKSSFDDIYRPFDPRLRDNNNSWTPKNSFRTSVSLDQRDIFYDPSKGYYLSQSLGIYGFFKSESEHYIRTDTKAQYYYTLFDIPVKWAEKWTFKCTFAVHTGLSFIFAQPWRDDDKTRVPIEEANKLAVDGMFIGRGWSNEYRNKGHLLLDTWVELRFPVVKGILAWDFFFDMAGVESQEGYYFGNNNDGESNFTINNLRFSFGGGFRFTMPQFPIRLSLAKRFRFIDNEFHWMQGAIGGNSRNPASGLDLVISFALSY